MIQSTCATDIPNAKIIYTGDDPDCPGYCGECADDAVKLAAMARGHCLNAEMAEVGNLFRPVAAGPLSIKPGVYKGFWPYRRRADYVERTFDVAVDFGKLGSPLA